MADAAELLTHKKIFNDHLRRRNYQLSSYHFSSIFLWQDFFDFTFEIIDGYLCVFAKHVFGNFLYLPPLGPDLDMAIIEKCFRQMNAMNSKPAFSRIENVAEEDIKHFNPKRYKITEKSKEYCYWKEDNDKTETVLFHQKLTDKCKVFISTSIKGSGLTIKPETIKHSKQI